MKRRLIHMLCIGSISFAALHAATRSSNDYSLATETLDAGGEVITSASYTARTSLGDIIGTTTKASPSETNKQGYIAQLAETTSVTVSAASSSLNETATLQLSATRALDDATTTSLLATEVTWAVTSGPIASTSSSGLATAATVYANTAASVSGSYHGITSSLVLTVNESIADNFGSYASDGLPDDWQVQYFGIGSANAAPTLDPDGDGYTNAFEYDANLSPISAAERFVMQLQAVTNQPTQRKIIFTPRYATSTYAVQSSTDFATWATLGSSTTADSGTTRTITDTAATGVKKFYRVRITRP